MKKIQILLLLMGLLLSACASIAGGKHSTYAIPLTSNDWTTMYDGFGSVTYSTGGIVMYPMSATSPSETHAALTLANISRLQNFRLKITAITEMQLRQNSPPNPWEVFWVLFNYNSTATGKNTNYFILKTDGVELGTATDSIGQTFLQTAPATISAVGQLNTFQIEKIDSSVTVSVNGTKVIDYTGAVFDTPGSIGLYTEDAGVKVTAVSVTPL